MLVKTFQAASMSDALQMVKAELGPEAMIISSRKERRRGIFGYFRKPVFEITATIDAHHRQKRAADNPYIQRKENVASTREEFQKSMLEPLVRELRELKDRVESMTTRQDRNRADGRNVSANVEFRPEKVAGAEDFISMKNGRTDIEKIRKMLIDTVEAKRKNKRPEEISVSDISGEATVEEKAEAANPCPIHEKITCELKDTGLDAEICEKLLAAAGSLPIKDESVSRAAILETLGGMIRCAGAVRLKKNGPRMIALVGPTGVGKTTTVAKLAAMYALKRKVRVALVTTDIFRAGAVEQLKTYAGILRVPMETASTKKELEKALAAHSDKDIILIDTAGKSARDCGKIEELSGLFTGDSGIEKHLCLSATTRDEDLQDIVSQFKKLTVHRVLFTKLDESRRLGCIANIPVRNNIPLSYLTNGQRVPEDIETAGGKKVAQMVLSACE
ncbi:MAG TPA: flagellar biosynthesis protein FlhF [Geobacteraceae bacterium]|nr:flagellar biosynthesis protein FlhF [Geobacteraceae bacterium]